MPPGTFNQTFACVVVKLPCAETGETVAKLNPHSAKALIATILKLRDFIDNGV